MHMILRYGLRDKDVRLVKNVLLNRVFIYDVNRALIFIAYGMFDDIFNLYEARDVIDSK